MSFDQAIRYLSHWLPQPLLPPSSPVVTKMFRFISSDKMPPNLIHLHLISLTSCNSALSWKCQCYTCLTASICHQKSLRAHSVSRHVSCMCLAVSCHVSHLSGPTSRSHQGCRCLPPVLSFLLKFSQCFSRSPSCPCTCCFQLRVCLTVLCLLRLITWSTYLHHNFFYYVGNFVGWIFLFYH